MSKNFLNLSVVYYRLLNGLLRIKNNKYDDCGIPVNIVKMCLMRLFSKNDNHFLTGLSLFEKSQRCSECSPLCTLSSDTLKKFYYSLNTTLMKGMQN